MSNTVIKVENLGKSYTINHEEHERYTAIRDVITNKFKNNTNKVKNLFTRHSSLVTRHSSHEEFWALKDINFEVNAGDRIGIIGRNGAGKSTLLKVLSRITEPTTGSVKIKGRVASLLEVGTGFHPELTGSENIYLNGAILGMSRSEVKKKFDEIVDFAEVEKFLDTPVKRYSSGMYVRLAFAVAAHLEPEILVVDEVLAVGDAQFQKKCLGKMEDVSKNEGRTVLFVSHNMNAIKKLCNEGILLVKGQNYYTGKINNVIEEYLTINRDAKSEIIIDKIENHYIRILSVNSFDKKKNSSHDFSNIDEINIEFIYKIKVNLNNFRMLISVINKDDIELFYTSDCKIGENYTRSIGIYKSIFTIPAHLLNKGQYTVVMRVDKPGEVVILQSKKYLNFSINEIFSHQLGAIFGNEPFGIIHPDFKWITEKIGANNFFRKAIQQDKTTPK